MEAVPVPSVYTYFGIRSPAGRDRRASVGAGLNPWLMMDVEGGLQPALVAGRSKDRPLRTHQWANGAGSGAPAAAFAN